MLNNIFKWIAAALLYTLGAILIGWTGYRTYHLLAMTTVNPIVPFLGLSVFDGGLVVWTVYFLNGAEGIGQRAVAFLASLLNLVLVASATVADVWLGEQTLVQIDKGLGMWALWLISGATAANLLLMWLAHMTDPAAVRGMKLREAQDKILSETYRQLDTKTDAIAAEVADVMSGRMVSSTVAALTGDKPASSPKPAPQARQAAPAQSALEAAPAPELPAPATVASQPASQAPIPELAEPIRARRNGHKPPAADPKA